MARLALPTPASAVDRCVRLSRCCVTRVNTALDDRRARTLRRDRQEWPSTGVCVLARPYSAGHLLLASAQHRRHHQREFRRRMDRGHHRAVRVCDRERVDVAGGAPRAPAAQTRHARWVLSVSIAIGEPFEVSSDAGEGEIEAARVNLEGRLARLDGAPGGCWRREDTKPAAVTLGDRGH